MHISVVQLFCTPGFFEIFRHFLMKGELLSSFHFHFPPLLLDFSFFLSESNKNWIVIVGTWTTWTGWNIQIKWQAHNKIIWHVEREKDIIFSVKWHTRIICWQNLEKFLCDFLLKLLCSSSQFLPTLVQQWSWNVFLHEREWNFPYYVFMSQIVSTLESPAVFVDQQELSQSENMKRNLINSQPSRPGKSMN